MKDKNRAAFLLRVSDRKQKEKYEDDIPTQRAINSDYIKKMGWVFVKEYEEPPTSAFKVSKGDRVVLKEALKDAKLNKFDILVVFHHTRLSRISEEYIVILNEFYKYGVRVFSATEDKELEVGDHNLKLIRFIEGWQSQGDSITKSIMVSAHMEQLARQGKWSGGRPAFGFRLTGIKGAPLEIDDKEKEVIEMMFTLHEEGCGSVKIAEKLNNLGFVTKTGKRWTGQIVYLTMQNPIIAGLPAYNRTRPNKSGTKTRRQNSYDLSNPEIIIPRNEQGKPKPVPEYIIIPLERWSAAMARIRKNDPRNYHKKPGANVITNSRYSQHLLTGFLRCGYCGSPMTGKKVVYKLADGTWKKSNLIYFCLYRSRAGANSCPNKNHIQGDLDGIFLDDLKVLFERLNPGEIKKHLRVSGLEYIAGKKRETKQLNREIEKAKKLVQGWDTRLEEYLLNPENSLYSEKELVQKIREQQEKIKTYEISLFKTQGEIQEEEELLNKINYFIKTGSGWLEKFNSAEIFLRKQMISQIIDKIIVWKDKIEINYAVDITFMGEKDGEKVKRLKLKTAINL